jgi:hypothetical protein
MTQVTANRSSVTQKFNENSTVDQLVEELMIQEGRSNDILTSISLDGREVQISETNEFNRKIGDFKNIDITFQSTLDLAFEALDSAQGFVEEVAQSIRQLAGFYQAGKTNEANLAFAETIERLDLFVQLMARIHLSFKSGIGEGYRKLDSMQTLEIHLLSVLKALLPAKEKEDIIMLCDLLEYELIDNLTQWKIKVIPELKQLNPGA